MELKVGMWIGLNIFANMKIQVPQFANMKIQVPHFSWGFWDNAQ